MKESDIERYLVQRVNAMGGLCWKFTSPGTAGVPDRIVVMNGHTVFVEVKAPGEIPRPLQVKRFIQIDDKGGVMYWVDSNGQVDTLISVLGGDAN
jgi:Holliday junction resolvase